MLLPTDEKLLALSQELLNQFDAIFGLNPGFRPAHAKGTLLTGMFTPSANAVSLTRAPHIANASTPVTVRFSDSSGSAGINRHVVGDARALQERK
jgi:catalase